MARDGRWAIFSASPPPRRARHETCNAAPSMAQHSFDSRFGRLFVASLFTVATTFACGGTLKYAATGDGSAVGADAKIVAVPDKKSGLTRLDLTVENLAPAARLSPGASDFVVWARASSDTPWVRLGALHYKEKPRTGELTEVSVPLTRFELVISVEKGLTPAAPSKEIVFSQKVN